MTSNLLWEYYEKMKNLLEQKDPETEPYKSKYQARDALNTMKSEIDGALTAMAADDPGREPLKKKLAAVLYHLGSIGLSVQELSKGKEHLEECLKVVGEQKKNPGYIFITLSTLNEMGVVATQMGDDQNSLKLLQEAETLYGSYTEEEEKAPERIPDLFSPSEEEKDESKSWNELEKLHTHTLYFLGQVYNNIDDQIRSAMYLHLTLRWQLKSKDYNPLTWALHASNLAQVFFGNSAFREGRHHLACATVVLNSYVSNQTQNATEQGKTEQEEEEIKKCKADVGKSWANYGSTLLNVSRNRVVAEIEGEPVENDRLWVLKIKEIVWERVKRMRRVHDKRCDEEDEYDMDLLEKRDPIFFEGLDIEEIERDVSDNYVTNYEDAKSLFLNSQRWLNAAKEYYTLECHASDYAQLVQTHSQLFKQLAFFDTEMDNRSKMNKRRVDMLEELVNELNPQHYLTVCKQLRFELAKACNTMIDLKLQVLEEGGKKNATIHALKKINILTHKSIKYFSLFLDLFKTPSGKDPEKYHTEETRIVLMAHFHLGRLNGKIIETDNKEKAKLIEKGITHYQFIVDYCEKYPESCATMEEELAICKNMVLLLPTKVKRLQNTP